MTAEVTCIECRATWLASEEPTHKMDCGRGYNSPREQQMREEGSPPSAPNNPV